MTTERIGAGSTMKVLVILLLLMAPAHARDLGQWEQTDPETKTWYEHLMQPDNKTVRCCGEADAYFADKVLTEGGWLIAVITDTRDDVPLRRQHVPVGTRIVIPQSKIKWDQGNPTGHIVLFLQVGTLTPLCYVQNGGV